MPPLTIKSCSLLAASVAVASAEPPEFLHKDVVVVGGGASGSYAALRLREDFGQSIALIEKQQILGGHVDSWTDPNTDIPYDYGVKSFIDSGNATGFLDRLGIARGEMPQDTLTTQYIDFKTGDIVEFEPPEFPVQLAALQKFLDQAVKYEPMIQGPGYFDFPQPDDIPSDLLIPYGDFITKYQLEDAMPFIYQTTGVGLGNMTNALTLFALQAFGASMARSTLGTQGSFVPASLRNQDVYDAVADILGDDVMYTSTVIDSWRSEYGVFVTAKNSMTGKITNISAWRLLIAIEPTDDNMAPFDLDKNEHNVLTKFTYSRLYTGIIDNKNLIVNMSYFNLPPNAAPDNFLSFPEASFNARIDYMSSGHYFRVTIIGNNTLDACGAKNLVQNNFNTFIEAGIIEKTGNDSVHWVDFSAHGPMHARVSLEEIKGGFFQKLNALQGGRSTWWTGGAWAVNFQTHLWEYDDIIMPKMLNGLV